MKVLKYSADPKSWRLTINCEWCKSQLEISADDLHHEGESGDYKDPGWDRYTFECGACESTEEVDENSIPNVIQSYVQKKRKKRK